MRCTRIELGTLAYAAHNNPANEDELDPDVTQDLVRRRLLHQNPKSSEEGQAAFTVTREGQRILNDHKL